MKDPAIIHRQAQPPVACMAAVDLQMPIVTDILIH
jgi:hypothetical protein